MTTTISQVFMNGAAQHMVGDGQLPNVFFVTCDGETIACIEDHEGNGETLAIAVAATIEGPAIVEDRLNGIVWENEASERRQRSLGDDDGFDPL